MSVLVFVSLGRPREYSQRLRGASASKFSCGMYILFFFLSFCILFQDDFVTKVSGVYKI